MASSAKRVIITEHEEYAKYRDKWVLFRDAYYGEGGFANGSYLVPHVTELDETGKETTAFLKRKELAWYLNYCASIIDSKHNHLFKRPIVRKTDDNELKDWMEDCDGKGTKWGDFLKNAQKEAQLFGHVFIFMDMPASPALAEKKKRTGVVTKADVQKVGVRPYVYWKVPEEVIDWALDMQGNFEWIKVRERYTLYEGLGFGQTDPMAERHTDDYIRLWTREETVLFDSKGAPIQRTRHNLGRVPCVILYNKRGRHSELSGISEIDKIAPAIVRLYNLLSELDEWLRNQAFSILTVPVTPEDDFPKDENGNRVIEVGTGRALPYSGTSSHAPGFIAADSSHAKAYEERIARTIEEIHRLAHMKYKGGVVQSGTAWAFDWEEVNNSLVGQAHLVREADMGVIKLWYLFSKGKIPTPFPYSTEYPESFSYSDEETEIAILRDFSLTDIPSPTFAREFFKNRFRRLLPNLPKAEADKIDQELNDWDPEEEKQPESSSEGWTGPFRSDRLRVLKGGEKPPSESSGRDNSGMKM